MSVDPDAGLLYVPISSPSPNFFGGNRKEPICRSRPRSPRSMPMTGTVVWSRQLVHHDLWDYDTNSPPVLVDLKKDGQTIPALVAVLQARLHLRAQPADRRADLSDRGKAGAAVRRCPASKPRRRSPMSRRRRRRAGPMARRVASRRHRQPRLLQPHRQDRCATTASSPRRASRAASSIPEPPAASNGAAAPWIRPPTPMWSTVPASR